MKKNFDTKLERLEEIVTLIQDKSVGLEESMKLFEEGVTLSQDCLTFLKNTRGHIEDLSLELKKISLDEDGSDD